MIGSHLIEEFEAIGSKIILSTLQGTVLLLAVQLTLGCTDSSQARPALANYPSQQDVQDSLLPHLNPKKLYLRSDVVLVTDGREGQVLFEKNMHTRRPIASLTKLMTAMVVIDANLSWDEVITITKEDRDRLRGSGSKLSFGTKLTRRDLIEMALAASENRAAAALGRTFPGGTEAIVAAMNEKAGQLGMRDTAFQDPAGLRYGNLSTAADLSTLVEAAYRYPLIRELSTVGTDFVTDLRTGWKIRFVNTNRLVRTGRWNIDLSKTGYIAEAGHCLVMRAEIADRPVIVVLLNSWGELTKYGDANRIRQWLDRADQKARETARADRESTS
ncbi:MAG TPA: serine hydrolase [Nitrospiria bacterium]|nr:serine hydrolase [Nitrospiria bacterium]